MKKLGFFLVGLLLVVESGGAPPTVVTEIPLLPREKWWGCGVSLGTDPLLNSSGKVQDLSYSPEATHRAPLLVSNLGRYIWSDDPFRVTFSEDCFRFEGTWHSLSPVTAGKSLREAYLQASIHHFPAISKIPRAEFFTQPCYVTSDRTGLDATQADLERLVTRLQTAGFPAGILVLHAAWEQTTGELAFDPDRFPDPAVFFKRLQAQGFRVLLTVSPYVSLESSLFLGLRREGSLIPSSEPGQPALFATAGGMMACRNLTNQRVLDHFRRALVQLQEHYGVDGFRFEGVGLNCCKNGDPKWVSDFCVNLQETWSQLADSFEFSWCGSSWKGSGRAQIQEMKAATTVEGSLQVLVPKITTAGLLGLPYISVNVGVCATDSDAPTCILERYVQLQSLLPVLAFSTSLFERLDEAALKRCVESVERHTQFGKYLVELAQERAQIGEPLVTSLEYLFPNRGFADCVDQFMLGGRYLVAPILDGSTFRTVRLPVGLWVDDVGTKYQGPLVLQVNAPAGRIPYFKQQVK